MEEYVRLGHSESVAGRPFTHLDGVAADLAALRQMIERLRLVLGRPEAAPHQPRPAGLESRAGAGRGHRIVISRAEGWSGRRDLTVVGFFGHKRQGIDPAVVKAINSIDAELVDEFARHPGILSYSSLELADGNFGNMVLLDSPEAKDHWLTSTRHAFAARDLAPNYYLTVRLHNGLLTGDGEFILLRTKYYDFGGDRHWRAVRELGPTVAP